VYMELKSANVFLMLVVSILCMISISVFVDVFDKTDCVMIFQSIDASSGVRYYFW
jgi:hypothetical protein